MSNEDKKTPPYFYFNTGYFKVLNMLSDEQVGITIKSIGEYINQNNNSDVLEQLDDPACKMAAMIIKNDVDRAFKSYWTKSENGKKGGAPKGNKNASKKKNTSDTAEKIWNFPVDEINEKLSYIIDVVYFEAEKYDFDIEQYYKSEYVAQIVSCYYLSKYDSFDEFGFEYTSLKDYTLNESASKVLKNLKEAAKYFYEDEGGENFATIFAECKQRTERMLKFPIDEIRKFNDKCDAILNPDDYTSDRLQSLFTNKEVEEIQAEINRKSS